MKFKFISDYIQLAVAVAIVVLAPTAYIVVLDSKCAKITSPWVSVEECSVPTDFVANIL